MAYTTNNIDSFLDDNSEKLYRKKCINYKGRFKKDSIFYIEFIAERILDNVDKYLTIKVIERKDYKIMTHQGISGKETSNSKAEVLIAKRLFKKQFDCLGKFIDYEVPLKESNKDKGVGKIDLLSYNQANNCINIIELKRADSAETLLRCILEIESYSRYLHNDNLLKSYSYEKNTSIEKGILIFKDTEPYKPFNNKANYPNLLKLLEIFKISVYILSEDEKKITQEC